VLVLIGGRDYRSSPYNRAVSARRQPGSVFKPIVALAALTGSDPGRKPVTLTTVLPDEPFRLRGSRGVWTPRNHDARFRGQVTVREAVEQSATMALLPNIVTLPLSSGDVQRITLNFRLTFTGPPDSLR
jgi:membrane carboxypeptidase/penicillin-binding protein